MYRKKRSFDLFFYAFLTAPIFCIIFLVPTFSKAIKRLEKKEIIKIEKAKVGRGNNFIINPFIITHDKRVPIRIFKMFESSIFNYTNQTSQLSSSEIHDKIREEKDTN